MKKAYFDIIRERLHDIFPNVKFSLAVCDENLQTMGLCSDAPCIVALDLYNSDFSEMMDELMQLEVDAYITSDGDDPDEDNPLYQRYLRYGMLWDIFYTAKETTAPSQKNLV